jgi:glutamine synthetase
MDNLRFVTFVVEALKAVYEHNGLLKASIVSATNAHRLGGYEAPPAIISAFLGKTVSDLLDHVENSVNDDAISVTGKTAMRLDIPSIPELLIDNTDRNRTSPFAFTGNRFEFRAVGSVANCSSAMITLNTAMAHTLTQFRSRVDDLVAQGKSIESAILKVVREDIKYTRPIRFDGNGYSKEWLEEANLRGLDCETSCPLIYDRYLDDTSVEMFESMKVMTKYELQARNEIKWDIYTKKVQIEARVFGDLCLNHIIPVVTRYQSVLIDNVRKVMDIFPEEKARQVSANNITLIEKISEHESFIVENVKRLIDARKVANRIEDEREKAIAYHDTVAPMIESIRYHIDELEMVVDDEMWSLPKYRELLFIR